MEITKVINPSSAKTHVIYSEHGTKIGNIQGEGTEHYFVPEQGFRFNEKQMSKISNLLLNANLGHDISTD